MMITKEKWQEFVEHKEKLSEIKTASYYMFLDIMDQCKEHGIAPVGPHSTSIPKPGYVVNREEALPGWRVHQVFLKEITPDGGARGFDPTECRNFMKNYAHLWEEQGWEVWMQCYDDVWIYPKGTRSSMHQE